MIETTTLPNVELGPDCGCGAELRCPGCGFNYLHQGRVTVFSRDHEDSELTCVTTIDDDYVAMRLAPSGRAGNPSSRRQGLAIAFSCEGCGGISELTIAQHKGNTLFAWRELWAEAKRARRKPAARP